MGTLIVSDHARWVVAAQAGDVDAFVRLVEALDRDVRLFVAARAPSAELVEEVVQAAFVTAYERLAAYEPHGAFVNWVKGIAHNHLRDELRRRSRLLPVAGSAIEAALAARTPDADDGDQRISGLADCLDRLAPAARALVKARYEEEAALTDLAQRLGIDANALAVRLHRVRQALRTCMEGRGGVPA